MRTRTTPNSDTFYAENIDIFVPVLLTEFNESLELSRFSYSLKSANTAPVFKKLIELTKPTISPLAHFRISQNPLKGAFTINYQSAYSDGILSKQQYGFNMDFNAQHSLLKLLEKWGQSLDQGLVFGVLSTDLSKAFDCLSHELLAAKLNAYGVDISTVPFIFDYLTNRK